MPLSSMLLLSLADINNNATGTASLVHLLTSIAEQTTGDSHMRKLIAEHRLQPTRSTLRQLRRMVLTNRQDATWQELAQEDDFYSLGGCRDRWFKPQDEAQLKDLMAMVSNEVEWKLIKARDEDGHSLATKPVQTQIQAEALRSEVQSVMGQNLSVYFQRRR